MTTATLPRPSITTAMRDRSVDSFRGRYRYVDHSTNDERIIELGEHRFGANDGHVLDAGSPEHVWLREQTPSGVAVSLYSAEGKTCTLDLHPDGVLRGTLNLHDARFTGLADSRVELIPLDIDDQPAPALVECHGIMVRQGCHHSHDLDVVRDVVLNDSYKLALRDHYGPHEVVVDVGAHIGTFAVMWHTKNPAAKIVCIEACPENIPVLRANVGHFATVIHAACSYEPGELALLNSVKEDGTATGGSIVVRRDTIENSDCQSIYWRDLRPLRTVTLEEALMEAGVDHIDVLKMDCEGSEFSIIENSPSISRVRFMLGEYHGQARWESIRTRCLADWRYGHMWAANDLGIFHLENPTPTA